MVGGITSPTTAVSSSSLGGSSGSGGDPAPSSLGGGEADCDGGNGGSVPRGSGEEAGRGGFATSATPLPEADAVGSDSSFAGEERGEGVAETGRGIFSGISDRTAPWGGWSWSIEAEVVGGADALEGASMSLSPVVVTSMG